METILLFFHFAGIIIALGAVTVIDTLGFLGRTSKQWTYTTIEAHHVTKPLIWLGTSLVVITWLLMLKYLYLFGGAVMWKSLILVALVLNGCFLSFYVSPHLDLQRGKKKLLSRELQAKIAVSFVVSFTGWWTLVYLTVMLL